MKKIDTTHWKEFRLGELFEPIRGTVKRLQILSEGTTPVIAAARSKQGIAGYYAIETPYNNQITVSCNGVGCGSAFYHNYPFNITGDAMVLLEKIEMPEYAKRFICCLIDGVFTRKYSYAEKCSPEKAKTELIKLPVNKSGVPDFAYMEQYIRSLEQRVQTTLTTFEHLIQLPKHAVDTTKWKAYKIGDLFMAQNTGNILTRDVSDGSGTTPFVTASAINNGVAAYIDASKYKILKGHCILVGGKTFTLTYQKDDFVSNDSHNFTLRLKGDNPYSNKIYLFLLTLLRTTLGQKYSWGDAVTKEKILENEIMLPATSDGSPDLAYMEQYVKKIERRVQQNLDKIA